MIFFKTAYKSLKVITVKLIILAAANFRGFHEWTFSQTFIFADFWFPKKKKNNKKKKTHDF